MAWWYIVVFFLFISTPAHFHPNHWLITSSPRPYGLFGSVIYNQAGTSIPTSLPSSQPSFVPSTSVMPSMSLMPSLNPSISASPSAKETNVPSISGAPSINPTKTPAPTNELVSLVTPTETVGDQGPEGTSGDGVMFDIVASKTLEVWASCNKWCLIFYLSCNVPSH